MFFLRIVAFLVIFSVIILIHELGHFWAAKKAGIKVEEFGFGLPPRIWGIKKGETIYSINWIPFGGFVRMLGEDPSVGKKSKRNIFNQSLRVQAWVVVAGVVMNFLLAFVLLTFGFLVGIEPLIVDEKDFMSAISDGTVHVEPGITVTESSDSALQKGDVILTLNDGSPILSIESFETLVSDLEEGGSSVTVKVKGVDGGVRVETLTGTQLENLTFQPLYLDRFVYLENADSIFASYLNTGDVLIQVNGKEIFAEDDIFSSLSASNQVDLTFFRPGEGEFVIKGMKFEEKYPVVNNVMPGSTAEKAGIQSGDQVTAINGEEVLDAAKIIEMTKGSSASSVKYTILRNGEVKELNIPFGEDGLIGVVLSDQLPYFGDLSFYKSYVPHSLTGFEKEQHGISAPVVAVKEMWRLGKLTAVMFVNVLGNFVSGGAVPDGVSGPVGIAQMTFVTIQAGFAALIRFVALLSLSLGVINILPLPALDGGRLFFILFQAVSGKKADPKIEGFIHNVGFFFLICFLLYITFNDVINLF
ncbi:RIP metalloprotease RseP [Patescibacteria group bacterium]|nr:RIP metalloprotease RseP [Patescibacteria group bacterium]